HRVGPVLAADAHELPDAADGQILVTLDAGRRNDPAQLADDADGVLARRGLLLLCGSGEDSDQYGDGNSKSRRVHIRLVLEGEGRAAGFHFTGEWKRARMRALHVVARVSAAHPGLGVVA